MKIVLVGSSGGIGSSILYKLKEHNIEVVEFNSKNIDLSKKFNFVKIKADGLIYCAGINEVKKYNDIEDDILENTININTFGFFRMCKMIDFSDKANIIAIGSLYSTETKAGRLPYCMSKHGLYGCVKTLALEMSDRKIKVNMISPGFVDTALTRKNNSVERIKFLENNIPLGLTSSTEIAKTCLFFLKENESITGQNIIVDGGYSLLGV